MDAISDDNVDFGLIISPVNYDPDPHLQPSGKIAIKYILIANSGKF